MNRKTLDNLDDSELIKLCNCGVEGAFDVLYSRYRLQLFSYLHRLMPERPSAVDDIFQQTWIKACRNFSKYQDRQQFFAWLCRIGHNLVMDFYRSKSNAATVELSEHIPCEQALPDVMMREQLYEAMQEAITQLPEEQQTVVRMRNAGITFKEIAERQQISLNTALGRMHYAVQHLRKLLDEHL